MLRVTAAGVTYDYSAKDIHRGGIWSRVAEGDSLSFELQVNAAEAAKVRLNIDSFQAGYRSLRPGAPNHPTYERYRKQALQSAQSSTATCVENFSCQVTPANQGPGQSTVALIIEGQYQCSGVLLNDVPGDGAPYVLTARHCEMGDPNGGAPDAASGITVYWNATSACGATLGSIYDPGIVTQNGATTVVEQQDAWLVKLDNRPAVYDAYFAGWDATGAGFVGGYTPHHALGADRQFAGWYGQAFYETVPAKSLDVGFDSTFWGTVNQVGSIGPGASGSGLFDADDRLVGTVVRALTQSNTGVCPANPPKVPSASSATALSTAFSGIFASTADPVSSTGDATLQSVLDPGHTGQTVVDGSAMPPYIVAFTANVTGVQNTGSAQSIYWYVVNARTCTASGGVPGDGWSGNIVTNGGEAATGNTGVTDYYPGTVTYGISCSNANRTVTAQTQITWAVVTPQVTISSTGISPLLGTPFELRWNASLAPCTASGAGSANGWNGSQQPSGDASFVEAAPGTYTYTLTCGSGSNITSGQTMITVLPPTVTLNVDTTNMRVGQSVGLWWDTTGGPCVASGGGAGDGWAGTQGIYSVTESVAGTYTYILSCGPGAYAVSAQVQVTFTNDPPAAALTLTPNTGTVASTTNVGYTLIEVDWIANVRPCVLSVAGPDASADIFTYPSYGYEPRGKIFDTRAAIGHYIYTATCGSGAEVVQASAAADWTGTPDLYFPPTLDTQYTGVPFGFYWQTNVLPCVFSGGQPGDGWTDAVSAGSWRGTRTIVSTQTGPVTYSISCGTGGNTVQASASTTILPAPAVTFTASSTTVGAGSAFTLSWNSNTTAQCVGTGGVAGDGWISASYYQSSGSVQLAEQTTGTVTFGITCGPKQASVDINIVAEAAPSFSESVATAVVGTNITLTWTSTGPSTCMATGGSATDIWSGTLAPAGTAVFTEQVPGTYTYGIDCGGGQAAVTVIFTANSVDTPPPPVTAALGSSSGSVKVAQAFTLSWSSTQATSCSASGGGPDDGWAGTLPVSGTMSVMESSAGDYKFQVDCSNSALSSSSMVTVSVTAQPSGGSNGGGGGGGGSVDAITLVLLGQLLSWRLMQERRQLKACRPSRVPAR